MKAKKLFSSCIAIVCVLVMILSLFAGCYSECKHTTFKDGKCTECGYPCWHGTYNNGVCTVCGKVCVHNTYEDGICTECGKACGHEEYEDGACTECGALCVHSVYEDGECVVCGLVCTHGEYTEDGYCEVCGTECAHENFTDSVCDECGLICTHLSFTDSICGMCGYECSHEEGYTTDGVCPVCGTGCDHVYGADSICTVCGMECEHKAYDSDSKCLTCGKACTDHKYNDQGVCKICGHHKFPDMPVITDRSYGLPRISVVTLNYEFEDADRNVPSYDNNNPDNNIDWQYNDCLVSVENCEKKFELLASGGIKVRGNWTTTYPKKPFRIKFDSKQSMLGLNNGSKMKSWVLLADYKDFTLERNSVAFYLGNRIMGSDGYYCSDYQQVELYLNGQYRGVYLLAEQQQVNKNRIDISEPDKNYTGTDIGYFFEYDGYYNLEIYNERFSCNYNVDDQDSGYSSQLTKADGTTVYPEQFGYSIKNDVYDVEQKYFIKNYVYNVYKLAYCAVYRDEYYEFNDDFTDLVEYTPQTGEPVKETVSKAIDIQSLVDMYIHCEIVCDYDLNWSSFLMDVDFGPDAKNNLLRFEAPWDFDSSFGLRPACENGEGIFAGNSNNPWMLIFINEDWFRDMVSAKWSELKDAGVQEGALQLLIDFKENYADAYARNFKKWGFVINGESTWWIRQNVKNHNDGVEHLYNWLETRFNYLDGVWLEEQ